MRQLMIVMLSFVLISCVSTTKDIKYYSLNLEQVALADEGESKPLVVISPIQMAPFLRQQGLVLQRGKHEIVTANHHHWAEPLAQAIAKLLQQKLNNYCNDYYFERATSQWSQSAAYRLSLEFNKFHSNDQSEVVVAGRYWFYEEGTKPSKSKVISISDDLERDGYLHMVEKLESAVDKLSVTICNEISQPNAN